MAWREVSVEFRYVRTRSLTVDIDEDDFADWCHEKEVRGLPLAQYLESEVLDLESEVLDLDGNRDGRLELVSAIWVTSN